MVSRVMACRVQRPLRPSASHARRPVSQTIPASNERATAQATPLTPVQSLTDVQRAISRPTPSQTATLHGSQAPIQRCQRCGDSQCKAGEKCKGSRKGAAPPQKRLKQTHLGPRALRKKGEPTLKLTELHDREHGEKVHAENRNTSAFKRKYREDQIEFIEDGGGTGLDEMVSTSNVAKIRQKLQRLGIPSQEIKKMVGKLSEQRIPTRNLIWPTGNPEKPLAGHPGALSKVKGDMRKGHTSKHTTKNRVRARWTFHQFQESLEENPNDLEKVADETSTMAQILTLQQLMPPYSQLVETDVSQSKKPIFHPKAGHLVTGPEGSKEATPGLDKAFRLAHEARERLKLQAAQNLRNQGRSTLVDPEMLKVLETGGDPMEFSDEETPRVVTNSPTTPRKRPAPSQAYTLSSDKSAELLTLRELAKQNEEAEKTNTPRIRLVSPPRSMPPPPFINKGNNGKPASRHSKRRKKANNPQQKKLTTFWSSLKQPPD